MAAVRRIRILSDRFLSFLRHSSSVSNDSVSNDSAVSKAKNQLQGAAISDCVSTFTACAYPDRIAKWKEPHSGNYILSCGIEASLPKDDPFIHEEYLAVAELGGNS